MSFLAPTKIPESRSNNGKDLTTELQETYMKLTSAFVALTITKLDLKAKEPKDRLKDPDPKKTKIILELIKNVEFLVDGEIGPTKLDVQMLVWLRANGVPHTVVATKHDKVKSSKRATRKKDLAAGCMLDQGDIVWVSASKGVGIEHLRSLVNSHLKA